MAQIRGGHTDSSLSRNPRLRASSPQDSTSQAPKASTIPSSKGGVPSNPPQRRYEMQRPPTTPGATSSRPESSVCRTPAKRARTSGLGESSSPSQPDPRALANSQRPSGMSSEAIIKWPMVTTPPIEGNSDCIAKPFHSELYFDLEFMRHPTAIHFNIDGRQGILEVRHVVKALHIPYEPDELPIESIPPVPTTPIPEATYTAPPTTPAVPSDAPSTSKASITISAIEFRAMDQHTAILRQIQQHLGLLPPPQPDIPRPSEPIALVEKTIPTKEATTEASSSHVPTTT
ncbi:hypothetical protein AAG906_006833 [Vitis piasezkii]